MIEKSFFMKNRKIILWIKKILFFLNLIGVDLKKFYFFISASPKFVKDISIFIKQMQQKPDGFANISIYPCLEDKQKKSGIHGGHYFYQDLYVARKIFLANPGKHVDIGSRIDGFVTHVASFRQITVLDIRPLPIIDRNISFIQHDLLHPISEEMVDFCDSISCLHTLEHLGLGRYGDPIDFWGYKKGFDNITKLLKPEGMLYISVPIGPQRIEFNAHRVFSVQCVLDLLVGKFEVIEFSYVDSDEENSVFFENIELTTNGIEENFRCDYGCGIFIAKKRKE